MYFNYSTVYIFNTFLKMYTVYIFKLKNNSLVEKIEQSHSDLFT